MWQWSHRCLGLCWLRRCHFQLPSGSWCIINLIVLIRIRMSKLSSLITGPSCCLKWDTSACMRSISVSESGSKQVTTLLLQMRQPFIWLIIGLPVWKLVMWWINNHVVCYYRNEENKDHMDIQLISYSKKEKTTFTW